jgi:hypothetical protein
VADYIGAHRKPEEPEETDTGPDTQPSAEAHPEPLDLLDSEAGPTFDSKAVGSEAASGDAEAVDAGPGSAGSGSAEAVDARSVDAEADDAEAVDAEAVDAEAASAPAAQAEPETAAEPPAAPAAQAEPETAAEPPAAPAAQAEPETAAEPPAAPALPIVVPGRYYFLKRWTFVLVMAAVWIPAALLGLVVYYYWFHAIDKTLAVFLVLMYLVVCTLVGLLLAMVERRPVVAAVSIAVMSAPFVSTAAAAVLHGMYFCERVSRCLVGLIPY